MGRYRAAKARVCPANSDSTSLAAVRLLFKGREAIRSAVGLAMPCFLARILCVLRCMSLVARQWSCRCVRSSHCGQRWRRGGRRVGR